IGAHFRFIFIGAIRMHPSSITPSTYPPSGARPGGGYVLVPVVSRGAVCGTSGADGSGNPDGKNGSSHVVMSSK
ncbi:MAG TPA: hypothetical protein VF201_11640, partial [Nitrolancea sp.]